MTAPLDYSLCNQTVTVYRRTGDGIFRQVIDGAYYTYWVKETADAWGNRQDTLFQLILPGDVLLIPGDRVYGGVGPHITEDRWEGFLPVTVPGLSQVQYVRPYFWEGRICHTEAGRK